MNWAVKSKIDSTINLIICSPCLGYMVANKQPLQEIKANWPRYLLIEEIVKSTPKIAMEALFGPLPLEIYIENETNKAPKIATHHEFNKLFWLSTHMKYYR